MKSIALFLALASAGAQAPDPSCSPRESFPAFITKFKQSPEFRGARIVFPLTMEHAYLDQAPTRTVVGSHAEFEGIEPFPLVTPDREAELAGGEGELCEMTNAFLDDREFIQYSCETDVYGNTYQFKRILGCWYLVKVLFTGS